MAGVSPVLLGVAVHQRADKVWVDPGPGELVPLVPLALHCEVARHPEGERSAGRERAGQVGSEARQQVLLQTGGDRREYRAPALLTGLTGLAGLGLGLGLEVVLLDVLLVQQARLVVQQGGRSPGGLRQSPVVTSSSSLTSSLTSRTSLTCLTSLPACPLLPVVRRFLLQGATVSLQDSPVSQPSKPGQKPQSAQE